jgi:hypothetical protein
MVTSRGGNIWLGYEGRTEVCWVGKVEKLVSLKSPNLEERRAMAQVLNCEHRFVGHLRECGRRPASYTLLEENQKTQVTNWVFKDLKI